MTEVSTYTDSADSLPLRTGTVACGALVRGRVKDARLNAVTRLRRGSTLLVFLVDTAHAMGAPGGEGGGSPIGTLLPFVLMFGVLYFLILRPQIKKQKAQQKMIDELKKGDNIVTSGGIHGVITNLKDDIISVKIAENVKVELTRSAVSRVKEGGSSSE